MTWTNPLDAITTDLKDVWTETNTNGKLEVMKDAPTQLLKEQQVGFWMQNDKAH